MNIDESIYDNRVDHLIAKSFTEKREEEYEKRIAEIDAEAERQKADIMYQAELDRNGGSFDDAFKNWGLEVLKGVRAKADRDNPTARVIGKVNEKLGK